MEDKRPILIEYETPVASDPERRARFRARAMALCHFALAIVQLLMTAQLMRTVPALQAMIIVVNVILIFLSTAILSFFEAQKSPLVWLGVLTMILSLLVSTVRLSST